jgi:endonuclease/exonuclease/phosphatase family metal-dependent hydrolase
MNVSPPIQQQIQEATSQTFAEWVDTTLKPEYLSHFHKNFAAGNYATMRSFWGVSKCSSSKDLPKELGGLTFVEEDCVSYYNDSGDNASPIRATTLRGMAKKALPQSVFEDLFQEVSSLEEGTFAWHVRGPRIFAAATRQGEQEPDILALQEYDCHDVVADYRAADCSETFAQAMAASGYDGVFFKDPLIGRDPPSGLGVFWKKDKFETISGVTGIETLECNTESFQGAVYNMDLEEQWHSTKSPDSPDPTLMDAADRRNGAWCRLRHKSSGRVVAICAAHLMTTSRDSPKTNRFPGQVRAGEISSLKALAESRIQLDDALLLLGDFNTNARVAKNIFSGDISASDSNKIVRLDTGFDIDSGQFLWGGSHALSDSFSDVHKWGEGVGVQGNCTSRNAVRIEWIDYIFHDHDRLRPVSLSDCTTPPSLIPNEKHPSDHLPLFAKYEFI